MVFAGLLFNIEKNWPNKRAGRIEDKETVKNGYEEIHDLYESFENWKPETKFIKTSNLG